MSFQDEMKQIFLRVTAGEVEPREWKTWWNSNRSKLKEALNRGDRGRMMPALWDANYYWMAKTQSGVTYYFYAQGRPIKTSNYYEEKIQTNITDSQISSRLNLVEDTISFFEFDLVQIIDMFGGIVFSLAYIFIASGLPLFSLAITVSILVYIFTKNYHKKIAKNNINFQNHDEAREEVISSRNKQRFKGFLKAILNLRISSSDLDAKAYLYTDLLQSIFLIFAIVITVRMGNYTSGQLFSVITYITMLNERVCEINEVRVKVYDLIDSVARLERNEE